MVPPYSNRISRVPSYSISLQMTFGVRGYHPLRLVFPGPFHYIINSLRAGPRSLAATRGISVDFFSSGYLDVSVLPVRFLNLCIQSRMTLRSGFPIRISVVNSAYYQLTTAFRRFSRPSSPVVAKASIVCTYSLDHTTSSYLVSK